MPIFAAIMESDTLLFSTPHYGACSMPCSMKTLLDHSDYLVLNASLKEEIFAKKASTLTTGAETIAAT